MQKVEMKLIGRTVAGLIAVKAATRKEMGEGFHGAVQINDPFNFEFDGLKFNLK